MYYIFRSPKTIGELVSICKTPGQVLKWMRTHIRHGGHDDSIQTPQITLSKRVCSYMEFAWLFQEVLVGMGISSYIITVKGNSKSVACFFCTDNKKLKCMVNRWTMLRKHDKIETAIGYIDRDWFRWIEWAVINNKLVPIKPHYRKDKYEEDTDTRSYLLCNRLPGV